MDREKELAWFGGFLDAEGTFGVSRGRQRYVPGICVGNTDQPTAEHVQAILDAAGLPYFVKHTTMHRAKPFWSVNVSGYTNCALWLEIMLPYLRTKQACARILNTYCLLGCVRHKPGQRWCPYKPDEWALLAEFAVKPSMDTRPTRRRHPLPCETQPIPFTPATISDRDRAWLSGFVDGDGSFMMVSVMSKYFVPNITIANTHPPTLPYVRAILDKYNLPYYCQNGLRPSTPERKPSWRISIRGLKRCFRWIDVFLPYLYTKRLLAESMNVYCKERIKAHYTFAGYSALDRSILALFGKH